MTVISGASRIGARGHAPSGDAQPVAVPALPDGDFVATLYATQVRLRQVSQKNAGHAAEAVGYERKNALQDAREAAERAEREAEESKHHGLLGAVWGKVANVAQAAATIASVTPVGVTTTGLIMAAGVIMSANSEYFAEHLGSGAGNVARWGGLGLSLWGGAQGALGNSDRISLENLARGTAMVARVGEGREKVLVANHQAESDLARADATAARGRVKASEAETDEVVALLDSVEKSARRAIQTVLAIGADTEEVHVNQLANMRRA